MTDAQPEVRVDEHNGDAAVDVRAADEAACLRGAVHGLAQLAGAPAASSAGGHPLRTVVVDGGKPADRLVALLNELIATIDVEGMVAVDANVAVDADVAVDANVAVDAGRVEAAVWLAPIDPATVVAPPKAATWHGARCEPAGGGWHARVVIDR